MKKGTVLRFVLVILLVHAGIVLAKYSGGDGSESNPWRISCKADLLAMGSHMEDYNDCFLMTDNIDLGGDIYTTAIIAADINEVHGFQGTRFGGVFDGNDFKILNLTIDGNEVLGLFGITDGGQIKNLSLENFSIKGRGRRNGCLVGIAGYGKIINCSASGNVKGDWWTGGLIGQNHENEILNCQSKGDVVGTNLVGGLVGLNYRSDISNSDSSGIVRGDETVGGLVGMSRQSNIVNCYSSAKVIATGWISGGLAGDNDGDISRCYSTGCVDGNDLSGGLIGYNQAGTIKNCYSKGSVNGCQYVGGLVALNEGEISNCYCVGDVNGVLYPAGLVSYNFDYVSDCFWDSQVQTHGVTETVCINDDHGMTSNVAGLTSEQMQKKDTYKSSGWNLHKVWGIAENQTYPYLLTKVDEEGSSWQNADINHDGVVDYKDLAVIAEHWLKSDTDIQPNIVWVDVNDSGAGMKDGDGKPIDHGGFIGQISKYEITNEQYAKYLNAAKASGLITVYDKVVYSSSDINLSQPYIALRISPRISYYGGDFNVRRWEGYSMNDHPVVGVTWYGAKAFCDYYGYRLPTEWEWQAVADFDGSYKYGCGTTINPSKANYRLDEYPANPLGLRNEPFTTPTGYYPAFGYGVCDMAGNVAEWTSSCYYPDCSGDERVVRGGYWRLSSDGCLVSIRYRTDTETSYDYIGFRVCR